MTPLKFLTGTVLARRQVTAGMVRVTLGGDGLRELASTGIADEYIRLFFPDPVSGELVLPQVDAKGHWKYPEGRQPAHHACYTIRAARPGEIDIDFVIHGHGRASQWAQAARPGDEVVIREPLGIYEAPADIEWLLLVTDATGLPAVGRLLESLGPDVSVRVIAEVPDAGHEQVFSTAAGLKLVWLHGSGNGIGQSRLPEAVRAVSFPAEAKRYAWVAGEARAARAIRRYLRHELGWSGSSYSVTGYWTDRQEAWKASWEALDPQVKQQIDALWDSGRDGEEIADEVEAMLERYDL